MSSLESATAPPQPSIPVPIQEKTEEAEEEIDSLAIDLANLNLRKFDPIWIKTLPVHKELSEEVRQLVNSWSSKCLTTPQ